MIHEWGKVVLIMCCRFFLLFGNETIYTKKIFNFESFVPFICDRDPAMSFSLVFVRIYGAPNGHVQLIGFQNAAIDRFILKLLAVVWVISGASRDFFIVKFNAISKYEKKTPEYPELVLEIISTD